MDIISDTKEFYINGRTAVAIGKFDGVHIGHQKLLMELSDAAASCDEETRSCVFTFDPAPSVFFGADSSLLTTRKEKRILFERKGINKPVPDIESHIETQEKELDKLAQCLRENLDMDLIHRAIGI